MYFFSSSFWSISPLDTFLPADGHLKGTHKSVSQTDPESTQQVQSAYLICVIVVGWPPVSFQLGFRAGGSPTAAKTREEVVEVT